MWVLLLASMLWLTWFANSELVFEAWALSPQLFFDQVSEHPAESVRLITALFLHGNWSHWLINCSVFILLAFSIERELGWQKLALVYLGAGVIGNAVTCWTMSDSTGVLLGASGAVSGLIGAWLVLFPNRKINFIVPIGLYMQKTNLPLTVVVGLWLSIQIILQFMPHPAFNVAWISHIVGFAGGFLLTRFVK